MRGTVLRFYRRTSDERNWQRDTVEGSSGVTRCLHFTPGCTTGWVNYANEPSQAALERSSQDAYDVIRLTRSKAAVWTVDDVARLIQFKKAILIYLLLPSGPYDPKN